MHTMTTQLLMLMGLGCLFVGLRYYRWRETWRRWHQTIPEIYREGRAGRPFPYAMWEQALQWLGVGLVILSVWRSVAGP